MGPPSSFKEIAGDCALCIAFYTRLPVTPPEGAVGRFADAQWAAPLAGLVVGLAGSAVFWLAGFAGLSTSAAALAAVGAGILLTGGLHEDGLADSADGFGGGSTPERRLEIMRDSNIGTFGALALILSVLARVILLEALASPGLILCGLVAAHGASRALLPVFMRTVRPARRDGLAATAGDGGPHAAAIALGIGAAVLLPTLGLAGAVIAALALGLWALAVARYCRRRIGGQTGDVLGALQQGAEILVLAVASIMLTPTTELI